MPFIEAHISKHGEAAIENMEDLLKAFPAYAKRASASALRSEGYRLKNIMQTAIAKGDPAGHPWPKLNPHTGILSKMTKYSRKARFEGFQVTGTRLKNFKSVWRGKKGSKRRAREYWSVTKKLSTRLNPMLKVRGAVRYFYDASLTMINVGFLPPRTVESPLPISVMKPALCRRLIISDAVTLDSLASLANSLRLMGPCVRTRLSRRISFKVLISEILI